MLTKTLICFTALWTTAVGQWPGYGSGYGYSYPPYAPTFNAPIIPSYAYDYQTQTFLGRTTLKNTMGVELIFYKKPEKDFMGFCKTVLKGGWKFNNLKDIKEKEFDKFCKDRLNEDPETQLERFQEKFEIPIKIKDWPKGKSGDTGKGKSDSYTEENCFEDMSLMRKDKIIENMDDGSIKTYCSNYIKLSKDEQFKALKDLMTSKKGPNQSKFVDQKQVSGRQFVLPWNLEYFPGFSPSLLGWPEYTIASPGLTPYYRKIQGRQGFMDFVTLVANGMKCMARLANHVVVGALHGVGRGELEDTCKGADPGQLDDFVSRHQVQG